MKRIVKPEAIAQVDELLTQMTRDRTFSGSVLIAQDGVVFLNKGYGLADRARGIPNTPLTRFDLGSMTKQFMVLTASWIPVSNAMEPNSDSQKLEGIWLVEPLSFDLFVDRGLVVPEFPVLAIKPNGHFKLFRIFYSCLPYDADGREVDQAEKPKQFQDICNEQHQGIREYGFNYAYGRLSAAGRWEARSNNRLHFEVESKGVTPESFQRILDGIKSTPQHARLATFYTTFYIYDGTPQSYIVDKSILRMTGLEPHDTIVYRSYRPEVIDTAFAVLTALDVNATQYFRCLIDTIGKARLSAKATPALFAELVPLTKQYAALRANGADQRQLEDMKKKIKSHPAGHAARAGRFGVYLGCPKRDQQ